ncbi:MAG: ferrochelatase [Acidobacteria bacterium]|nr:ferrochelatase [Acidobacteriota bacterium]
MKQGVLLLAHGAPERLEDVAEYLSYVRGGQPVSPRVLEEVRSRYEAIGGSSPLTKWTRAQAGAVQATLGIPVFFGMRNWHPFVKESMEQARAAGIQRMGCVCLAPQYAEMSIGLYMKHAQAAAGEIELVWAHSYHEEPALLAAFAERLGGAAGRVLFTAHSLPEPNQRYEQEARATAAGVARAAGIGEWDFAFQSQGMSGGKWLGPTVESCLDRYAAEGVREITLQPIGFVCDHVEILYDVDIHFRDYAAQRGIALHRPESLNGSPKFTAALAEVARKCLQ